MLDDQGVCIGVSERERGEAEELIEQFMIMANGAAAVYAKSVGIPFVYRVHEAPDEEKLAALSELAAACGFQTRRIKEGVRQTDLAALIDKAKETKYAGLISTQVLRSMSKARYDPRPLGHFGLSLEDYCHFTSPIRRYPDLQIHRIIKENLRGRLNDSRVSHYEAILDDVAGQSSRMERLAQEAEREVIKLKKVEYMEQFLGKSFTGVISGVTSWGIYVELENTVEGMIPMNALLDDYYIFDEGNYQMVGQDSGRVFSLGQTLEVTVSRTDKLTRTIDFIPTEFTDIPIDDYTVDEDDPKSEELLALYKNSRIGTGRNAQED